VARDRARREPQKHEKSQGAERRIQSQVADYPGDGGTISYDLTAPAESAKADLTADDYAQLREDVSQMPCIRRFPESIQTIADP